MGELKENGSGAPVEPKQTQEGGQPAPVPMDDKYILVFEQDLKTGQVNVRGGINDMGKVYQVVFCGLDAIRRHNELNGGYLKARQEPKKHGMLDFVRGKK
jgi:hypothetical protein